MRGTLAALALGSALLVPSCYPFGPKPFQQTLIMAGPIFIGDTARISAVALHDNDANTDLRFPSTQYPEMYDWASLHSSIATIDEFGLVTAIDTGAATITVAYHNGDINATAGTVVRIVPIVTTLQVQPSSFDVRLGDTISVQLTTLTPGQVSAPSPYAVSIPSDNGTRLVRGIGTNSSDSPANSTPAIVRFVAIAAGQSFVSVKTLNQRTDRVLSGQVSVKVSP